MANTESGNRQQSQGGQREQSGQPEQGGQREEGRQQQQGGGQQRQAGGGQQGGKSQERRESPRQLRLQERGREAYGQAQQLASTLEEAVDEVGQFLREQADRRPYVSVATAAGIGYILGGGVPSRLTGFLFGLGSRFAVEMFLRELIGEATAGQGARGAQQQRSA